MSNLTFSGHESFFCKQFWLKKGFDFVLENKSFTDNSSVVHLGVGKNMVSSIRFWMKSFGLLDKEGNLTDIAKYLFGKNGKDLYLEDLGTLWLLHYHLIKTKTSSIYDLVFNELRKERSEFTRDQLHLFIKRKCFETGSNYNVNTIDKDINVFKNNYTKPEKKSKNNIEDDFSRLFIDLNLIDHWKSVDSERKTEEWFKIENKSRNEIPFNIILFVILDNESYGQSISLKELQVGNNSPGSVFAISTEGLLSKLQEIQSKYTGVVFTDTAGVQVLQFRGYIDKWGVLDDYYNS